MYHSHVPTQLQEVDNLVWESRETRKKKFLRSKHHQIAFLFSLSPTCHYMNKNFIIPSERFDFWGASKAITSQTMKTKWSLLGSYIHVASLCLSRWKSNIDLTLIKSSQTRSCIHTDRWWYQCLCGLAWLHHLGERLLVNFDLCWPWCWIGPRHPHSIG